MINQLLAGVHIAAAAEAITFAAKQGLDLAKVYEVITASAGNSWMFENRVPHILEGDYHPLSAIEIFVKDLGIIQDMARTERYPVPLAAAALQMYLAAAGSGYGEMTIYQWRVSTLNFLERNCPKKFSDSSPRVPPMPKFAANLTMMFNEWPFLTASTQQPMLGLRRLNIFSPTIFHQRP